MKKSSLALAVALACAGCGRKQAGASCGDVTAKLMTIANAEIDAAHASADTARLLHDQLPAMRDSLDQNCKEQKWDRAVRDCLAGAADHAAFVACETQLSDAQKAALDRSTRGEEP